MEAISSWILVSVSVAVAVAIESWLQYDLVQRFFIS
jgi:hypothetical protein